MTTENKGTYTFIYRPKKEIRKKLYDLSAEEPEDLEEFIGSINIGEAFGLSSLIEPFEYTSVAVASQASTGVRIDAIKLRKLAGEDPHLGFELMKQVAKASFERLSSVRVELAAARS